MKPGTAIAPARALREFASLDPFRLLSRRVNRLFEDPFTLFTPTFEEESLAAWAPPCDIYETGNQIVIKAELPELKKENVTVSLEDNVLTIRGERKFEDETKRENYHRIERRYGEFMRSFTLPLYVEPEKINAEFKEGVLRVTLPKREEMRPKQIEVKVK
jgi:HSP20 family protein